jgi:hypothetical protein
MMRTSDPPEVTPEDAISDLYRANSLRLAHAALLLVGGRATAEDVVQEAFYGLQRRWLRDGGPGRDGKMTNSVLGAAYEADGRALIAEVGAKIMRVPLGGNGRPVTLAAGNDSGGIDVDGTGRFALYVGGHRIVRVDLRTGQRASFPVPLPEDMGKGDTVDSAW